MYTATGFNAVYGHSFRKLYNDQDYMSATFVRLVKVNPALNTHISREELNYMHLLCVICDSVYLYINFLVYYNIILYLHYLYVLCSHCPSCWGVLQFNSNNN